MLFVCTGNTCRSVLAEYIARTRYPNTIFESAGLAPQPAEDAENAIYTLRRLGIDASAHEPTDVEDRDLDAYDTIVAIGRRVANRLRSKGIGEPQLRIWSISDPWGDDLTEYSRCAQQIMRELSRLGIC